jgi:hypothetical protein
MADNPFAIPQAFREMTEANLSQAKAAYEHFSTIARQSQDMMTRSTDAVAANARDVQQKALRYAQAQMEANFSFVAELAKSRDLKEMMEVQAKYAKAQATAFQTQAQELTKMMTEPIEKVTKKR